jgi:hypothetical protein
LGLIFYGADLDVTASTVLMTDVAVFTTPNIGLLDF